MHPFLGLKLAFEILAMANNVCYIQHAHNMCLLHTHTINYVANGYYYTHTQVVAEVMSLHVEKESVLTRMTSVIV